MRRHRNSSRSFRCGKQAPCGAEVSRRCMSVAKVGDSATGVPPQADGIPQSRQFADAFGAIKAPVLSQDGASRSLVAVFIGAATAPCVGMLDARSSTSYRNAVSGSGVAVASESASTRCWSTRLQRFGEAKSCWKSSMGCHCGSTFGTREGQ